jgi:hypothetical protein
MLGKFCLKASKFSDEIVGQLRSLIAQHSQLPSSSRAMKGSPRGREPLSLGRNGGA